MSKNKEKGTRFETKVVREILQVPGLLARRLYGSTGRSERLPEWVDIVITSHHEFYLQCKNWKRFRKELFPDPELKDLVAQIVKYPKGKPHAMLRLPMFLTLLRGHEMLYSLRTAMLHKVEREADPVRKAAFLEVYQEINDIIHPQKDNEAAWSSQLSSKAGDASVSSSLPQQAQNI